MSGTLGDRLGKIQSWSGALVRGSGSLRGSLTPRRPSRREIVGFIHIDLTVEDTCSPQNKMHYWLQLRMVLSGEIEVASHRLRDVVPVAL